MKALSLLACLIGLLRPALGAETTAGQAATAAVACDSDEGKPFRDPFAAESEHTNTAPKIKDPLQPINRAFFHFNDKLYLWVLKPAGKGYGKVVPQPARTCVRRLFANVKYPIHFVNNVLQGKIKAAGLETTRFLVNSTIGIGGLFDPASHWKLEPHKADFDQTLGFYGLKPGIYFDWPVFGPSSARGTAGLAADGALSPWTYVGGIGVTLGVPAYREVNGASLQLGDYESFKKATLDPYVAMRSAYYESRAQFVRASKAKPDTLKAVTINISQDDFRANESHPSTVVLLAPGDALVIKLGSNLSTGYRWTEKPVNSSPEVLTQDAHEYSPHRGKGPKSQPLVGVGGVETWTFKAGKTGITTLDFSYGHLSEAREKATWGLRVIANVGQGRG